MPDEPKKAPPVQTRVASSQAERAEATSSPMQVRGIGRHNGFSAYFISSLLLASVPAASLPPEAFINLRNENSSGENMPSAEATAPPRERTRLTESNVRDALTMPLLSQDATLQQNWEAVQRSGDTGNVVNKVNLLLNQLERLATYVRDHPGATPNPNDYSLFAGLSSSELQAVATGYSSLSTDERNFFQLRAIAFFVNGSVEIAARHSDGEEASWSTLLQEAGDNGQPRALGILETARQDVALAQTGSSFLTGIWDWITGRSRSGPVRTEEPTTRVATVPVPTEGTPLEEASEDVARRILAEGGVDLDSLQDIQFGFEDIVTLFYANSLQARLNGIFRPSGGAAPVVTDEDYYAAQAGAALDTYAFLANNYSQEELAASGLDISASAFASIPLTAIGSPEDRSRVQLAGWSIPDIWNRVKDETAFWNLVFVGASGLARVFGELQAPVWRIGVGQINEIFAEASRILNRDIVGVSGDPANPIPNSPLANYQKANAEVTRLEARLASLEGQRANPNLLPAAVQNIQKDIRALTPDLAAARQALTAATPPLAQARAQVQAALQQLRTNIEAVRILPETPAGYGSRIEAALRASGFTDTSIIIGSRDPRAIDSVLLPEARGLNAQNLPTGMRVEFELLAPATAGGDIGRMSARLVGAYEPSQNAFARVLWDPFRVVGYAPGVGSGIARAVGVPFRIGENTFLELAGRGAAGTSLGQRLGAGGLGLLICAGIEYGLYSAGKATASHWTPEETAEETHAAEPTTPVAAGPTEEQRAATADAQSIMSSYAAIQSKQSSLTPILDAYLRGAATIGLPRSSAISEDTLAQASLNMQGDRTTVKNFLASVAEYLSAHPNLTPEQAQVYFYQRYFERHSTDAVGLISTLVPESGRLGVYKEFFTSVMRTWPGDENMVNALLALPAFSSIATSTINTKFPWMTAALKSLVTSPSEQAEWYGTLMVYAASPGNERLTDRQMLDYFLKSLIPNIDLLNTGLFSRTEMRYLRDAAVIEWARIAVESGQDLSIIDMNTFYPVLARYMSSEYPALRDILDNITALPADGGFKMLSYRLLMDLAAGIAQGRTFEQPEDLAAALQEGRAVDPTDLASAVRFLTRQFNNVYPGQTVLNSFSEEGKLTIVLRYLPYLEGAERRTLTTAEMEQRVLSDESLLPLMAPAVTLEELQQRHAAGTLDAATFISMPEDVQMAYWNWLKVGDSRGAQASRRVLWTGATDAWREDHSFLKPTGRGRGARYPDWPVPETAAPEQAAESP